MGQIVKAELNEKGNHVIEVKPLKKPRVSESGETVQISGTSGWAETLPGVFHITPEGETVPCTCIVQIRHKAKRKK